MLDPNYIHMEEIDQFARYLELTQKLVSEEEEYKRLTLSKEGRSNDQEESAKTIESLSLSELAQSFEVNVGTSDQDFSSQGNRKPKSQSEEEKKLSSQAKSDSSIHRLVESMKTRIDKLEKTVADLSSKNKKLNSKLQKCTCKNKEEASSHD
jgi:glutamyl/glutaminyl-tRNA synthetase